MYKFFHTVNIDVPACVGAPPLDTTSHKHTSVGKAWVSPNYFSQLGLLHCLSAWEKKKLDSSIHGTFFSMAVSILSSSWQYNMKLTVLKTCMYVLQECVMWLTGIESQVMSMNSSLPDDWLYDTDVTLQLSGTAGTVEKYDNIPTWLVTESRMSIWCSSVSKKCNSNWHQTWAASETHKIVRPCPLWLSHDFHHMTFKVGPEMNSAKNNSL